LNTSLHPSYDIVCNVARKDQFFVRFSNRKSFAISKLKLLTKMVTKSTISCCQDGLSLRFKAVSPERFFKFKSQNRQVGEQKSELETFRAASIDEKYRIN